MENIGAASSSPDSWSDAGPRQASAALGSVGRFLHRLRPHRRPPPDPDLRYRNLFECVSDGFALVEVIRDPQGRVTDYRVLEANPALLRLFGWEQSPVGKLMSQVLTPLPGWLKACETAVDGRPLSFEFKSPSSSRWFEIHLSRIAKEQLAQLVVEITDRKQAERRQSEMFEELNHRVKNNLAIVSAMLTMQARSADQPHVREPLERAVDRIQTIADVHAALYRTGRTDEVDFAAYLRDLCERLSKSVIDSDRIELRLQLEPVSLGLEKAVALGVVVNELVTNAAKHAYPAPATGVVSVRLGCSVEGLRLSVGDSGPGLPAGASKNGLGMRLVRSLVQQMGANFEIERHPGVTFHVSLSTTGAGVAPPGQPTLL